MNAIGEDGGRREEAGLPASLRGWVSRLIRTGLAVAGLLFVLGLAGYLARGAGIGPLSRAAPLPGDWVAGLARLDPAALVLLGLIVLLGTPLLRVALSVALFARKGNREFTALTLTVLVILGATVVVGVLR